MIKNDTKKLISAVDQLITKSGDLVNRHGFESTPGSISENELKTFDRPLSLKTAYSQGHTFVEVAGDQLMAFARTLTEPIQTVAPFSCARSVLESGALSHWLLDNNITATERVGRSLAFRFEGMVQQMKLANSSRTKNNLETIDRQTQNIIDTAHELGYQIFRNKDRVVGVATRMPSITNLTKTMLNKEFDYRLLSAVTHAHHFALAQTSFAKYQDDADDPEVVLYEKSLDPRFLLYLCKITTEVFINAITDLTKLHGTFHLDYEHLFMSTSKEIESYYRKINR